MLFNSLLIPAQLNYKAAYSISNQTQIQSLDQGRRSLIFYCLFAYQSMCTSTWVRILSLPEGSETWINLSMTIIWYLRVESKSCTYWYTSWSLVHNMYLVNVISSCTLQVCIIHGYYNSFGRHFWYSWQLVFVVIL